MYHSHTEEPRYTLKTLTALYYGATYGPASGHGTVQLLINDDNTFTFTACVHKVGPSGLIIKTGGVELAVDPSRVLYAEVV